MNRFSESSHSVLKFRVRYADPVQYYLHHMYIFCCDTFDMILLQSGALDLLGGKPAAKLLTH